MTDDIPVEIDDVAGLHRVRLQPADDIGVATGRHETDVLAVMLVCDRQSEASRQFTGLRLGHIAERKAQEIELFARGGEQEVALVAIRIRRTEQRARSAGQTARRNVMTCRKCGGAKLARGGQQIAELDRAVALDAGHRRFTRCITVREILDHGLAEAAFIVQHVVRNAEAFSDIAGVMNVLPGAAGPLAMSRGAMIVKLQGDPDDVVALGLQQRGRHRRIDAT